MKPTSIFAFSAILCALANPLWAETFTFNNSTPGTYQWSTGMGWNTTPVSGNTTTLNIFPNDETVLQAGTVTLQNNLGTFTLNRLNLHGTGPATSGTATVALTGNRLVFTDSGGVAPMVQFSSINPAAGRAVRYTISNHLELQATTTFKGENNGNVTLSGGLSGAGDMVVRGNVSISGDNRGRTFSGDILVEEGSFSAVDNVTTRLYTAGDFRQTSTNIMNWNTTPAAIMDLSVLEFQSNALQIVGAGRIYVNDADTASKSLKPVLFNGTKLFYLGAGDYEVKPLDGNAGGGSGVGKLYVGGVGTMSTTGVTTDPHGTRSQLAPNIYAKGTFEITGTTGGNILGSGRNPTGADVPNSDGLYMMGGVLRIAPTGSGLNIAGTGLSVSGSVPLRLRGGAEIQLNKGGHNSLALTLGNEAHSYSGYQVIDRSRGGTLVITPGSGLSQLGVSEKLSIAGSGSAIPTVTHGMVLPYLVGKDADGKASYLTYDGSGTTLDTGFKEATYSAGTLSGATDASVVKIVTPETVLVNTSVYALRNDSSISIDEGQTLTVGSGNHGGIILNGGEIHGGTLAFGSREALIYTSAEGGSIGSRITGAGATVDGIAGLVSLTKFGEGTLSLTGENAYTGQTVINQGALRVEQGGLPTSALILRGGVLETNGVFTRAVGAAGAANVVNFSIDAIDAGGGFAAHGGGLIVNLGGSQETLTWGSTNFLRDYGLLSLGSKTANDVVEWQNGINLGAGSPVYFRQIHVEDNPDTTSDYAVISGVISDTDYAGLHGLQKVGGGTLVLTANNTYTGVTAVSEGTLMLGNGGTSGSVMGDIRVYDTLAFNRSNTVTYAGEISATGAVVQMGSGTTILTGANTHSGGTVINAGTLLANNATGSALGSGDVTVNQGTLGGTGFFTGSVTVNSGGTLAPGASIETLSSGALTFNDGSNFSFELDSLVALAAGADLQIVNGNLTLNGAVNLLLTDLAVEPSLFAEGTTFTLINYTGEWNGGLFTVNGSVIVNGGEFAVGLNTWRLTYDAAMGGLNFNEEYINGSYLNIVAVPEPSPALLAAVLFSVGSVVLKVRRIRAKA